jgi:hypothetical protein
LNISDTGFQTEGVNTTVLEDERQATTNAPEVLRELDDLPDPLGIVSLGRNATQEFAIGSQELSFRSRSLQIKIRVLGVEIQMKRAGKLNPGVAASFDPEPVKAMCLGRRTAGYKTGAKIILGPPVELIFAPEVRHTESL